MLLSFPGVYRLAEIRRYFDLRPRLWELSVQFKTGASNCSHVTETGRVRGSIRKLLGPRARAVLTHLSPFFAAPAAGHLLQQPGCIQWDSANGW